MSTNGLIIRACLPPAVALLLLAACGGGAPGGAGNQVPGGETAAAAAGDPASASRAGGGPSAEGSACTPGAIDSASGPTHAVVERVVFTRQGEAWTVAATVRHPDTGWDHYADSWRITDPEGKVLAERALQHPHVDEQPFTRVLQGVTLPPGVREVIVEAHCKVDGWGGPAVRVDLTRREGPGYRIEP